MIYVFLVLINKGKARRNKSVTKGSQFNVLQDLKQFTDKTLPILKERKELGLDMNTGTSVFQDRHF